MVTQNVIIETVKNFASEIKNSGINLKKVYLFGSYAKNQQKEHSDIDVALVADEFTGLVS
ncbi:MAG: nucleotidyltransferase domain-containing protein [Bacteroidia bacterium]|nr:nucleotidyltransferase domain-containing protein [Bacteroidia bacterium]